MCLTYSISGESVIWASKQELYTAFEGKVRAYNEANTMLGGKAVLQRYTKGETNEDEQPLILAICINGKSS